MIKKIMLLATIATLVACGSSEPQKYSIQGFAQGTTYSITYINNTQSVTKVQIDSILRLFDYSCSLHNKESLLTKINANITDSLDTNISECLGVADSISRVSKGTYDVTIKPLTSALGFAAEDRQNVNRDSLLQIIGYKKISVISGKLHKAHPQMQIDLNSIAKGYSVDLVGRYLKSVGINNYIVEIGGEICASGKSIDRVWRVGIDKPFDGNMSPGADLQAIVTLENKALATSGNYRKFYTDDKGARVNHTLDPLTASSVTNNMMSVTVIAQECIWADGLATMMMAMGLERSIEFLENHSQTDAYIVYSQDNELKTYITDGAKRLLSK